MSIPFKEELARAIARKRGLNPDADLPYGDKPAWQYFTDDVEAVLDRMRGPSEAMIKAGDAEIPDNIGSKNDARSVYIAMIKKAAE